MTLYKNIFAKAWSITRMHPALWLLGTFVLFWGGKGIELEQFFTNADLLRSPLSPLRPTFWEGRQWLVLVDLLAGNYWLIAAVVAVLLLTAIVSIILIVSAQIGLLDAYGSFSHKKDERYTVHHAFAAIKQHLVRVGGLQLLMKGIAYLLVIVIALPLFFNDLGGWRLVFALLLFLVVTPMSIILSAIAKFGSMEIITKDAGFFAAIRRGAAILRQNAGVVLEFMVFVYVMYALLSILVTVFVFILTFPMVLAISWNGMVTEYTLAVAIYKWTSVGLSLVFALATSSIFSAWHMGSWALLYQELVGGHHRSLTHRLWKREKVNR